MATPIVRSSIPSLPPPSPKSPPEYPDLYGKRRESARVQMLEREISFLEEELKSVEGLQPASRCCKEMADFVIANSDPLLPSGMPCFNFSWICCCCCCCEGVSVQLKLPRCECKPCSCNCLPSINCSLSKWNCCFSCPKLHCCKDSCGVGNCCIPSSCCKFKCPSCSSCCSWKCSCTCSCPTCPKVHPCCCCTKSCWNPCWLCC
ncbi:PREDICTED: guanine nucleotide-binding protein subunit gamma 3-like isoform X3 [Lupinus angustifolius]|uniref:guanine nucleotide-binding protein subunit gamma 3-like isoform X3 n=1 Tax=Lupinus angustifolius TaxID=3871 RepID=UPI00092E6430|nr:PREDICTED: guanine nucleotide-binding protein subunit gamma 3-like isoform X3 [Lupinus angustifolius]